MIIPPNANGDITIPNVFALSKDGAIAALRRAGYQSNVTIDSSLCGSVVEGRVIEVGLVCQQNPPAGRVQSPKFAITITVQTENPWHGNIGKPTEWRLMPNLVGKSLDQARAEMQRVGFSRVDKVYLAWVNEPDCAALTVCRTNPGALDRAGVNSMKTVYVAEDPNAAPKTVPPKPDAPSPDGEPTPSKPTPTKDAEPEPFF